MKVELRSNEAGNRNQISAAPPVAQSLPAAPSQRAGSAVASETASNMTTTAIEAREEIAATIQESINQIEAKLSAQALDGSPMLLMVERGGQPMVYGHWEGEGGFKVKGFRHADAVPNHLCGTFQFSPESAQRNAAALAARGEVASYTHWRAFLGARLQAEKQMLANI